MRSAPTALRAQLSDATTQVPPAVLPKQSGRNPWGSLTQISFLGDMSTREYAPSSRSIALLTASSIDGAESLSRVTM